MKLIALLVAGAILALALHRLALWMETRGWIYYRRRRASSSTLGNAFLEVQSMLRPESGHVLEERRRDDTQLEEAGDPPDPGPENARRATRPEHD